MPRRLLMAKRLNRYLAEAGLGSRRGVEQLIIDGRVSINGKKVLELGVRVNSEVDRVSVDGRRIRPGHLSRVLIYHKPKGVVCSFRRQGSSPCLADSLAEPLRAGRLFHIGRLDRDSTGLLLLGADGDLAHALLHPSRPIWKRYRVRIDDRISPEELKRIREGGIRLDGKACLPAKIAPRGHGSRGAEYDIALREGKNRQIRRMFESFGRKVRALHRTSFGPIALANLPVGGLA